MSKQNRKIIIILIFFFTATGITPSFFIFPSTVQTTTSSDNLVDQEPMLEIIPEIMPEISQFIPRTIRVAIYNEPNTTRPSYASVGYLTNSYADLKTLLEGEGYQVYELTLTDIQDHKLMTADYDVFIMVNNLPRESIVNLVKEFWLGGGGIMSFDSAISYICYAGMIPPESEGLENYGVYWNYAPYATTSNIVLRHPVTKEYQVGDAITESNFDWAAFDWSALMTSAYASDFVKLATKLGYPNDVTVVGNDPSTRGGRVIQMFGDGDDGGSIGGDRGDIIIDAVEWLCPRPKGRILFDLMHHPRLGVDPWDTLTMYPGYYSQWRDNIVSRGYTFDKLYYYYTADTLNKYDALVVVSPDIDFLAVEPVRVRTWVSSYSGSLFIFAENPLVSNFYDTNARINYLLTGFNIQINQLVGLYDTVYADFNIHPTTEACDALSMDWRGALNITGNAFSVWETGPHIVVAGQEYGDGRVIMSSDMNWLTNAQIANAENRQYGINVINWLTSDQAEVLIYVDEAPSTPDPNDNLYKGPLATALNDLDIEFYLTFSKEYFNLSLHLSSWTLVIMDSNYYTMFYSDFDELIDALISHVENGGSLLISSWEYFRSGANTLWDYCGFQYVESYTVPPTIYIWDDTHNIFNFPAPYSSDHIDTTWNYVNTDCSNLTLHSDATAFAGLTSLARDDSAAIILGGHERVLTNAMLLTAYYNDTDDSTYPDALELWENEIMFMLYQTLSVDIISPLEGEHFGSTAPSYEVNFSGYKIYYRWYTINDGTSYYVPPNGIGTIDQSEWDTIPYDSSVSLKFYVEDIFGQQKYKEVNVTKTTKSITVTSPDSSSSWETDTTHSITWTSEGSITGVKIELYKDGVFELEIIASTTNDGEYSWTIPSGLDDSTLYQIKIMDISAAIIYDYSDNFEIFTTPEITVTSPDSSSSWETETTHSITWTSEGSITDVKIELYEDGAFVLEIIASTDNDGEYSWTIPAGLDNSTLYQIKITDVSTASIYDYSEDFEIFTIPEVEEDSITVTSPDSSSSWETESTHSITWTSTGSITDVKIELYEDGVFVLEIVASTDNDGEYSWTIPAGLDDSTQYQINISDVSNPDTYDISEYFEIYTPDSITVTSPESSSSWETESTHSITWTSTGSITDVKIELYKDGAFVLEIVASTTNDGEFSWTIPSGLDNSTQYQINISDVSNPDTYDLSENFEILTIPEEDSITITNPSTATAWEMGTSHAITWTSTGSITTVKIELYKAGVFVLEIIASTANDGSYTWAIPTDLEDGIDYQIKISDVSNPATYDESPNFAITSIDIPEDGDGIIPSYNLYIIIGIISVVSVILVKNRKKIKTK